MRFNDDGTIELNGQTLRIPDIGEKWDFEDARQAAIKGYLETLNEHQTEYDEATTDDGEVPEELAERFRQFNRSGLIEALEPWYRELFTQLGEGDPGPIRSWSLEMLNPKLPVLISDHWRNNPKVSGEATPTPTDEPPRTTTSD